MQEGKMIKKFIIGYGLHITAYILAVNWNLPYEIFCILSKKDMYEKSICAVVPPLIAIPCTYISTMNKCEWYTCTSTKYFERNGQFRHKVWCPHNSRYHYMLMLNLYYGIWENMNFHLQIVIPFKNTYLLIYPPYSHPLYLCRSNKYEFYKCTSTKDFKIICWLFNHYVWLPHNSWYISMWTLVL